MAKPLPTIERLHELLNYDPETGILTWKVRKSSHAPAGAEAGGTRRGGYRTIGIDQVRLLTHRVCWAIYYGYWPEFVIDHRDVNPCHNWITNLRDVQQAKNMENQVNCHSTSASGLLGAYANGKSGTFQAKICKAGVTKYLGTFGTAKEAHDAYLAAKKIYHPESFLAQHA